MALVLIAMAALWGCSDDDDPVTPQQTAFEVMAEAGAAYINGSSCPGVISAADVSTNGIDNYTILDVRRQGDYLAGHIPGAINATLANSIETIADQNLNTDDPILVVCYSGQSAGHVKVALEMMGYTNVKSLLYGMAGWDQSLAYKWDNSTNNLLVNPETTNNEAQLVEHAFPGVLDGSSASGIVAERVNAMLQGGFKGVSYSEMLTNGIENYFIVNYFGLDDYMGIGSAGVPGHIPGAFQFTPKASLGIDQMLKNLPPEDDARIVVYCWTGQHSSQVVAYLNMLGYDAYSLLYGSNSLFHDVLGEHVWNGNTAERDLEVGAAMSPAFEAILDAATPYINGASCPGVVKASDVNVTPYSAYTIFDIRTEAVYNEHHIPGAHWSTLATLLTDVDAVVSSLDDPILVACYTGQSAGYAKIALELMGYTNVKSMNKGMSDWHTELSGPLTSKIADTCVNPETVGHNDELVWNDWPALLDSYDAGTALETRVQEVLEEGLSGIMYSAMLNEGLENFFIVNYWGPADYDGTSGNTPGHVPGAFQFTPNASLAADQMLANLPAETDAKIVVYCWTGQHSAQVTAYLRMLGYDAYSLKFGSYNLFHSSLTNPWNGTTNMFDLDPPVAP